MEYSGFNTKLSAKFIAIQGMMRAIAFVQSESSSSDSSLSSLSLNNDNNESSDDSSSRSDSSSSGSTSEGNSDNSNAHDTNSSDCLSSDDEKNEIFSFISAIFNASKDSKCYSNPLSKFRTHRDGEETRISELEEDETLSLYRF